MSYRVALNFEDGVTQVITCLEDEAVLDAAYRAHVKLPMDCSDGVCGTCRGQCRSGSYDLGDDYLEEALSEQDAALGYILTCQMRVRSDVIIDVPASSSVCATGPVTAQTRVAGVERVGGSTYRLTVDFEDSIAHLPGQYINISIPGTAANRAYSFSSRPGETRAQFLIKQLPTGQMSEYLADRAQIGDRLTVKGPMGSFYLRDSDAPMVMLAGGTGLAPLLSMLRVLSDQGAGRPIHLLYGVNEPDDLVELDVLDELVDTLAQFSYTTVVVNASSGHSAVGFVTDHFGSIPFSCEGADVYLCGPPPMVDAVCAKIRDEAMAIHQLYFEKFNPSAA